VKQIALEAVATGERLPAKKLRDESVGDNFDPAKQVRLAAQQIRKDDHRASGE